MLFYAPVAAGIVLSLTFVVVVFRTAKRNSREVWQIDPAYFDGARRYTFTYGGKTLDIRADAEGYFELANPPEGPLGVFARRVTPQS